MNRLKKTALMIFNESFASDLIVKSCKSETIEMCRQKSVQVIWEKHNHTCKLFYEFFSGHFGINNTLNVLHSCIIKWLVDVFEVQNILTGNSQDITVGSF